MIVFNSKKKQFHINTARSTYILGINGEAGLYTAYYGKKLTPKQAAAVKEPLSKEIGYHTSNNRIANYLPEVSVYDGYNVFDNTVKAVYADGNRTCGAVYAGHFIKDDILEITLTDKDYGFHIVLCYRVRAGYDLIEKSIKYVNGSKKGSVTLESFNSGGLVLPEGDYMLGFTRGRWADEMRLCFEPFSYGKKVLESRTGNSSHIHNPSFFITKDKEISEDTGEYWFGQLLWSGNWKFSFEKRLTGTNSFIGGLNDFDGYITLKPGGSFETPVLLLGYSGQGTGQMSRSLHDYYRNEVMPPVYAHRPRPVRFNSWEGFYFDINEEKLGRLADLAAKTGVELFVVDDGWFRHTNDDTSNEGDWITDRRKFPHGMRAFGDSIKRRGLKFGIWMEPEMMNVDSALFKAHPEWRLKFPHRSNTLMRNQLILDISRKDVREYLKKAIQRLVLEYNADYVKWDMNRYITEAGSSVASGLPVWIRHTKAAYELMEYMKSLKPELLLEGCAGGGGRFDGGLLSRVDQIWLSDNTDPYVRLKMQYVASLFYPAISYGCHVSDSPTSLTGRASKLEFRLHAAMSGNLGVEANLFKWSEKELGLLKQKINEYKTIRHLICCGDQYRLAGPYNGPLTALMYVSKDMADAVVFAYATADLKGRELPLRLKGLNPSARYELQVRGRVMRARGSELMKRGIKVGLKREQESVVVGVAVIQ